MSTKAELITKIMATIYANDANSIDAEKHQELEVDIVNSLFDEIGAINTGFLGYLSYLDNAPTPGKDGFYILTDSGPISYITDSPVCYIGDYVSVLFSDGSYNYTLISASQYIKRPILDTDFFS